MTKNMIKRLREVALYASVVGALSALIITIFLPWEKQPDETFKVIDQYKGCDVVRYTTPWGSNYHYFLDCRK